jgi:hypothetical protein
MTHYYFCVWGVMGVLMDRKQTLWMKVVRKWIGSMDEEGGRAREGGREGGRLRSGRRSGACARLL